jgi:hypothetical protein
LLRPNCVHADNCICGVAIGNSDCFRSSVFVRFFNDFVMKPDKVANYKLYERKSCMGGSYSALFLIVTIAPVL